MNAFKRASEMPDAAELSEINRLLLEQLPQVRYIARRIHDRLPRHIALEDLMHSGVLGLIEALHKFNPAKNVQFKSYAKYRIRGAILDSLRELDWCPRTLRSKARKLEEAQAHLAKRLCRPPCESELADELDIRLEELQRLRRDLSATELASLQAMPGEDGRNTDGWPAMAGWRQLPDNPEKDPFHQCLRSEIKDLLARAVEGLPRRERQVISLYYFSGEPTMKVVGAMLGVGEARVSQIHAAAIVHLRARMQQLLEKQPLLNRLQQPARKTEFSWGSMEKLGLRISSFRFAQRVVGNQAASGRMEKPAPCQGGMPSCERPARLLCAPSGRQAVKKSRASRKDAEVRSGAVGKSFSYFVAL